MVGGHWVALGRWIEMILYALLHPVNVEGDGTPCPYSPCQGGWREMLLRALIHLVKVGGGRWYSMLSYTLSKWVEEVVLHALIHLVKVEEDGTPCSLTPWWRWREMVLHALTHLVKVEGNGTPYSDTPCQSGWREMELHALIHLVNVEGDGTTSSHTPCQSGWKEMVLHALIHLVNVEEELNSRFVAYLCLHLCIVVYNVYIYILYRCIQFVFVFVSLLEHKRAQSFVLERRLGLVAIHSR